jgi:hypothetical protein
MKSPRTSTPSVGKHRSAPAPSSRRGRSGAHRQAARRSHVGAIALLAVAATAGVTGAALDRDGTLLSSEDRTPPTPTPTAEARPTVRMLDLPITITEADNRSRPKHRVSSKGQKRPATSPSVPETGSGDFFVAAGTTAVSGSGPLTTYTVEVEEDLPLPLPPIADAVDAVLTDPRSWTAGGSHGLQRTDSAGDVRVLIATPETTDELCAPLDTGGRLSCRNGSLVVLNAWRWVNGAPAYGGDLTNYRRYLINHEFGHALGNPHEECPEEGALAPVMMQQTKGVEPCQPNPWPDP